MQLVAQSTDVRGERGASCCTKGAGRGRPPALTSTAGTRAARPLTRRRHPSSLQLLAGAALLLPPLTPPLIRPILGHGGRQKSYRGCTQVDPEQLLNMFWRTIKDYHLPLAP